MPKSHKFGLNKYLTVHSLKTTSRPLHLQEQKAGRGRKEIKEGKKERRKELSCRYKYRRREKKKSSSKTGTLPSMDLRRAHRRKKKKEEEEKRKISVQPGAQESNGQGVNIYAGSSLTTKGNDFPLLTQKDYKICCEAGNTVCLPLFPFLHGSFCCSYSIFAFFL